MKAWGAGFTPIEKFLVALVQGSGDEGVRGAWEALPEAHVWSVAVRNEIEGIAAHALAEILPKDALPDRWIHAHKTTARRISGYLEELDRLAARLSTEGIRLVALKNGGIARGLHPCPGCCPMGDLDVLVERRHFRAAHKIVLEGGYQFEFRSPLERQDLEVAERTGSTEYRKTLSDGETLWLELNWRPVAGRWIRPDQEPASEDLVARSVGIPGSAVRLLAPEDNLLQVSLHTAKHSYVRAPGFRLHTDVDRIVRGQRVDWASFVRLAGGLQVKTPVYFSLAIPRALLGTPIPMEVLDSLRPAAWKEDILTQWIQRAGLLYPDQRKFGRLGFMIFTSLLYDDARGLGRAVFPEGAWMRDRYRFRSGWLLPLYHARRLTALAFRRSGT